MKKFVVRFSGEATIELSNQVIDAVDDEWRSCFYNLETPSDIAEHIAYNLVFNRVPLSRLDGWANQPDSNARLVQVKVFELEAELYPLGCMDGKEA